MAPHEFLGARNSAGRAGQRLVIRPASVVVPSSPAGDAASNAAGDVSLSAPPTRSCDRQLNGAIELASARPSTAFETLAAVQTQCPDEAGPLREMAGVRFSERRWHDAGVLAERAVALDPQDAFAWELLASSRYLEDDFAGALRAWNRDRQAADQSRSNRRARARAVSNDRGDPRTAAESVAD